MTLKYFAGFSDGAVSALFLHHIFRFTWAHSGDGIFLTVFIAALYLAVRVPLEWA